jgi:hypothetical protein
MSLAILLGGWVAASVIFSPLIGRFLAGPDKGLTRPRPMASKADMGFHTSPLTGQNASRPVETMRRNVAIQLYRREAGWPRAS